jgi:hypothetical protein
MRVKNVVCLQLSGMGAAALYHLLACNRVTVLGQAACVAGLGAELRGPTYRCP